MRVPSIHWILSANLGALLMLSGCSVPRTGLSAASMSHSPRHATVSRISTPADADLEKRIDAVAHFAAALSHDLNDQPEKALEHYFKAAQADPDYEPVVVEAARRLLRAGKPDEALALLLRASGKSETSGSLHAWIGLAYAQLGRLNQAITQYRSAIRKAPGSFPAYQNLAQLYLQSNRPREALAVLDEAFKYEEAEFLFLLELAELYARYARLKLADRETVEPKVLKLLERARRQHPDNPIFTERLADFYAQLEELDQAAELYLDLVELFPDHPELRQKLAELYIRAGQNNRALKHLEVLVMLEPTNPQTHLLLGAIAVEEQDYTQAIEHLGRVILLHPDIEPVYYELAGLHINLRQPEKALEVLENARKRFKPAFVLEFYSGLAHSQQKNYSQSVKHYMAAEILAATLEPERLSHLFYFQSGAAHERSGNHAEAEKYLKKTLELSPDFADALNYLGYMWADLGVNLEEAKEMITRAVQLEPESAAYLDSMGWVLYRLEQPEEALEWLLKAIEFSEEPDAVIYDHLGDVYAALDQMDKAREAWEKAMSLEPSEEIRAKLQPVSGPTE
jgi:tetratricopeptide (TPR) repeat protein